MISPDIDVLWHGHILHTALYSAFCQQFHGELIQHLPCSSYALYGISEEAFASSECTSCKKPICSIQTSCYGTDVVSIAQMRQSILMSASEFRRAYGEAFGVLPDVWKSGS